MADEYKRERARKQITLPTGDKIYIPVITKLSVLDQNGQEVELTVDNTSGNQTREVHVDQVPSAQKPGAGSLSVERIDDWIGLDLISQAQESKFIIDNVTGADTKPPSFTTHQKTHVYRYYQNPGSQNDNGVWIDSELIDELSVVDQNGQEHIYFLTGNPERGDAAGQADANDPDITVSDTIDPPYRTDPFQNIVNWNGHQPTGEGPGVRWIVGAGFFLINDAGVYTVRKTADVGSGGQFVIHEQTLAGHPLGDVTGTWSIAAAVTEGLANPPAGTAWTHWTSVSGGDVLSANIVNNLGASGPSVSFSLAGATFTATPPSAFVGLTWSTGAGSGASTSGTSVGQIYEMTPNF